MNVDPQPLSLYQPLNTFQHCGGNLSSPYYEFKTKINNDLFPEQIYRGLQYMQNNGFGEYKVGGSTALKFATGADWKNDDVDIMVYTTMDKVKYAGMIGLTNLIKSWTKGEDRPNLEREERFHDTICAVLTYRHDEFNKNIQLVFFEKFENSSFVSFLDGILDYPAHVLYEIDFDKDDKKTYNFFVPTNTWDSILEKRIPRNLHCLKSETRIQKYMARGFEFF